MKTQKGWLVWGGWSSKGIKKSFCYVQNNRPASTQSLIIQQKRCLATRVTANTAVLLANVAAGVCVGGLDGSGGDGDVDLLDHHLHDLVARGVPRGSDDVAGSVSLSIGERGSGSDGGGRDGDDSGGALDV